jgi:hypothetical protein
MVPSLVVKSELGSGAVRPQPTQKNKTDIVWYNKLFHQRSPEKITFNAVFSGGKFLDKLCRRQLVPLKKKLSRMKIPRNER